MNLDDCGCEIPVEVETEEITDECTDEELEKMQNMNSDQLEKFTEKKSIEIEADKVVPPKPDPIEVEFVPKPEIDCSFCEAQEQEEKK